MWAFAFIKLIVMLVFGGVYHWLGRLSNRISGTNDSTSENRIIGLTILALICVGIVIAIAIPAFSDRTVETPNIASDNNSSEGEPLQYQEQQAQSQDSTAAREPSQAEIDWLQEAVALEESDPTDFQGQLEIAKNLVSREPASILGWSVLGSAYENLEQFDEAREAFSYAIELDSSATSAWAGLGRLYIQAGQYAQAEEAFERVVSINPNDIDRLEKLGILYRIRGDRSAVVDIYQKMLAIDEARADMFFESNVLP
jgi:tetratricopeptide (TPR) repeat protein